MLHLHDAVDEVKWNIEILGFDRGKRRILHQRTHNIVVDNGRQFVLEAMSAASFSGGSFTRVREAVVRYMGVGIGGTRQVSPLAASSPLASPYPDGYGGTNTQTDDSLAVSRLERPVKVSSTSWLKQIAAPPTFPTATSVTYTAVFGNEDLNVAPHAQMPVSEIGLFSSLADPAQPNGGAGTYPGGANHMIAYDTFNTLLKTGYWLLQVNWTWQI